MKKLYLAGPQVFEKNASNVAKHLKNICKEFGFEGLFPLDAQVKELPETPSILKAKGIFEADLKLLLASDAVIADFTPFRGPSMDVGTAVEIGIAVGLGKPVFGYTKNRKTYFEKVTALEPVRDSRDSQNREVEDFSLIDNLMCVIPAVFTAPITMNFTEAVLAAQQYFAGSREPSPTKNDRQISSSCRPVLRSRE